MKNHFWVSIGASVVATLSASIEANSGALQSQNESHPAHRHVNERRLNLAAKLKQIDFEKTPEFPHSKPCASRREH
jgi:hypothetical protein